ncbi:MAG TPA: hypothetical protein VGK14_02850 [Novimethylophilus sp.]|jgi:Flp pilus assembly protein TadD|uniref:tetratricopeptide repeat protein n=1 Tax=Novimethylophilus sp. TaxID=2137426 RepID=UPI002F412ECE
MSLLIKALQKAEQSKEKAGAKDTAKENVTLELTPQHDELNADVSPAEASDFYAQAKPMPSANGEKTAAAVPARTTAREAAANLFRAHTETAVIPGGRRAFWLGLGGLTVLLLCGIGFYFYLQSLQQPEVVVPRQPVKPVTSVAVAAPAAPDSTAAPAPPETPGPSVAAAPAETKPTEPAAVASLPVAAPPAGAKPAVSKPEAEDPAIKVTRNRQSEPAVNATAVAAYQAFTTGDDAAAARLYRQLLQAEPRNLDALLGLAAISARRENTDDATHYYLRTLELEPKNSIAQAGLIALLGQADPVAAESRLKTLLAQQPEAAYLHAALGGVYAGQGQWPNAQQAYFQAFRLDATDAEHAFNLAVSLDQMGKPEHALDYYQRARELLLQQGGAIDRNQLNTRIDQLRSALGK